MSDLTIHFDVDPNVDAESTAAHVRTELGTVENVGAATATTERTRFGPLVVIGVLTLLPKIIPAIHQTAEVIHDSSQLLEDSKTLVEGLRAIFAHVLQLVKGTPGVTKASVDVGLKSVAISDLTDDDIDRIAAAIVARMATTAPPATPA